MICVNTKLGNICISEKDNIITEIRFTKFDEEETYSNKVLEKCKNQLLEYFDGQRKSFDFKFSAKGTDFQKKVWNELLNIPYGKTISYKELAEKIGKPNAYRAVANANRLNPIPIIIPCHRVIGSNGKMIGYASGLDKKIDLLKLEKAI